MIELYKMVTGKYNEDPYIKFKLVNQTRGNQGHSDGGYIGIYTLPKLG